MVDELPVALGHDQDSGDSDSEIKTEPLDQKPRATAMNNYSESEIITEIGGGNFKPATPFRAVVAQSVRWVICCSVISQEQLLLRLSGGLFSGQ